MQRDVNCILRLMTALHVYLHMPEILSIVTPNDCSILLCRNCHFTTTARSRSRKSSDSTSQWLGRAAL